MRRTPLYRLLPALSIALWGFCFSPSGEFRVTGGVAGAYAADVADGARRTQQLSLPSVSGVVHVYVSFRPLAANPAELVGGEPKESQTLAIGCAAAGKFTPAASFGMVKDTHTGLGNRATVLPWLSDGQIDYYGMFARPQTPYDFKLKLDLHARRMSVWVSGRGDDGWFPLAENVPLQNPVDAIDAVRVEESAGAPDLEITARSTPWPEGERVRPLLQSQKSDRHVDQAGFQFQSMRSLWMQPGRHVTIARNNPQEAPRGTAWIGFPDVAPAGPDTLVCSFTAGGAHGGGGPILVSRSEDRGKTWSAPSAVHPSGINCSRIQKLRDGSLLVLADLRLDGAYGVVFYRSTDAGKTWRKIGFLDPHKAGGHSACVPSRVLEMPDGAWLLAGSYCIPKPFELKGGEQIEIYRSADQGATWTLHAIFKEYPYSLSEASFVREPGGRLWMFLREACRILPGVKTYSDDGGKTWARCEEMPFPIVGRTCAGWLNDGRVLLTFRAGVGVNGLWAWVGTPGEKTTAQIVGAHFNDAHTVGLKDGALHIDNDGACGQFTRYFLRAPDSPDGLIDVTVEVKVVRNRGYAATLSIPYFGKLRMFPDHVELSHDPSVRIAVSAGEFHTYRVVVQGKRMTLFLDGKEVLASDKADTRTVRSDWTPITCSPYLFAFGNEPLQVTRWEQTQERGTAAADEWQKRHEEAVSELQQLQAIPPIIMISTSVARDQITPRAAGYSIWKRVEARLEDPKTGVRRQSWIADRDGFPDQYQMDRVLQVEASIGGGDQGYSGWTQLADGRVFVVNYTDDTSPACLNTPNWPTGLPWIRGTWIDVRE